MKDGYEYHGADVSYFSGIPRPALLQKGVHFREVQPVYGKIREATGVSFIPVLFTPEGEAWQDSSDILDRLEAAHPEPALYPSTPVQRIAGYLVELYGNEGGLLPAMHYRWSFEDSVRQARADFAAGSGNLEASSAFADRMAGSLPMLGVNEATIPAIEAHVRELFDALSAHFEEHAFLLGDRMSLADCGLMGPLYGHLYRDAVPGRLMRDTAFRLTTWIDRMNRPNPSRQTGWLAEDRLAPTFVEALRVMADCVPVLEAQLAALDDWADANAKPGDETERAVGMTTASFRGAEFQTGLRPYSIWMTARLLDQLAALTPTERTRAEQAFTGTGWDRLLAIHPRHRIERRGHSLYWV